MLRQCENCGVSFEGRPRKKTCSTKCRNVRRSKQLTLDTAAVQRSLSWRASPRGRYLTHRQSAKRRGIVFNIQFADWFALWEPYLNLTDGVRYCMCRTGDKGAYAVGNVRIDTARNNNLEARGLL